jgi:hypothetical protein
MPPTVLLAIAMLAGTSPPWRVELATAGGITGRGSGSIDVSSDGHATRVTGRGAHCDVQFTRGALARLASAVRDAHLERWRPVPPGGASQPDRVRITLTASRGGRRGKISWREEDLERVPQDARAVADAASELARAARCASARR